jgi:hypothetical protein
MDFSVYRVNVGHWDILVGRVRIFAIRGSTGDFFIRDERDKNAKETFSSGTIPVKFPTVDSAMAWICATLMGEAKE